MTLRCCRPPACARLDECALLQQACWARPPAPSVCHASRRCRSLARLTRLAAGASEPRSASSEPPALAEDSEAAKQELLLFAWVTDVETRVQKALNSEQYDLAQALRARLDEVATVLRQCGDARRERGGAACSTAAEAEAELTGQQARALVLRSQLAAAVAEERYSDAAALRDQLAAAEAAAAASEAALDAVRGGELRFAIGQRVIHATHRWTGIIAGFDRYYADTEAFAEATGVEALPRGKKQPFYVVLPDTGDVGGDDACVMYVAEDRLRPPPALAQGDECPEAVQHPLAYSLFLGPDAQGGYIPTRELRERYGQPRADVWPPGEEPE